MVPEPNSDRTLAKSFVRAERLTAGMPTGFFVGPPDLAVEVLSPNDRPGDTAARIGDWLKAGTQQVWVVDPESRTLLVHRQANELNAFAEHESVSCDDVIPGFVLPLGRLFV